MCFKNTKKDLLLNYYVVAYIDLMGQSESLDEMEKKFSEITNTKGDKQDVKPMAKKTFGVVRVFRDSVKEYAKLLDFKVPIDRENIEKLSPEKKNQFKKLQSSKIEYEFLGDAALIYVSLAENVSHSRFRSIEIFLNIISLLMINLQAKNIFIRGAIDVGACAKLEDGTLYGSAIARAYSIETKWSQYPRIVIGNEAEEIITNPMCYTSDAVELEYAKLNLPGLIKLLAKDYDGLTGLNYLAAVDGTRDFDNIIIQARENIEMAISHNNDLMDEKKLKLYRYYSMLLNFNDRMSSQRKSGAVKK